MATLKETLKVLNKSVAKADQFMIASEVPEELLTVEYSSFGSPRLDNIAGGIGLGRMTLLAGWEGSGKTTYAMLAAAEAQKKTGKYVVYFDGEYTIDSSYMDRTGIDRNLFILRQGNNLEEMLDDAELFSKTDDICMIIFDSIKSFVSKVVEDKSAEDNTIGIEAKKLNARMAIINGNAARRKIALIVLNQYRENPGVTHGSAEVLPGGHWQKYFPSLHLRLSKKDLIKDSTGEVIGHVTNIRIKKSKYRGYDPKQIYESNLYYAYGFDRYDEYAALLTDLEIIKKGGAWYTFPNGVKKQGLMAVSVYLEDNPEYLEELIKQINGKETIKSGPSDSTEQEPGSDLRGVQTTEDGVPS